jgi:hypothetical protein
MCEVLKLETSEPSMDLIYSALDKGCEFNDTIRSKYIPWITNKSFSELDSGIIEVLYLLNSKDFEFNIIQMFKNFTEEQKVQLVIWASLWSPKGLWKNVVPEIWKKACSYNKKPDRNYIESLQKNECPDICGRTKDIFDNTIKSPLAFNVAIKEKCSWTSNEEDEKKYNCFINEPEFEEDLTLKQLEKNKNCSWYDEWKAKVPEQCNNLENEFKTEENISNIDSARKLGCDWIVPITQAIKTAISPSNEYDARRSYGALYTMYLSVMSDKACSIFSIVNPSATLKFTEIIWLTKKVFPEPILEFPMELLDKEKTSRCLRQLLIIPIALISDIDGHFNAGVFDLKNKTFERFEPHGDKTPKVYLPKKLDEQLTEVFQKINVRYIPPGQICPMMGPQLKESSELENLGIDRTGFCQVWGIWYFDERMKNPNVPPNILLTNFMNQLKTKGIGAFVKFITNYSLKMIELEKKLIKDHNPDKIANLLRWIQNNFAILSQAMSEYVRTGKIKIQYKVTEVKDEVNIYEETKKKLKYVPKYTLP